MIIQTYKTTCANCGNELEQKAGDMTGNNEIIIEFIDSMKFDCSCGKSTYIEIETYSR